MSVACYPGQRSPLSHRDWAQICRLLELQDEGMLCLGSVPEVSTLPNLLSPSHPLFRKEMCLGELIEVVQQTWVQELLGGGPSGDTPGCNM